MKRCDFFASLRSGITFWGLITIVLDRPKGIEQFDVQSLAQMARGGRWRTEAMRSYSRPVLIWFTKGQGRITVSGVRRGYGAHNAVYLPLGTMHGFDMLGQVFGHVVFFSTDPGLGLPETALHLRIRDGRRQAELTGLIDQIAAETRYEANERSRALPLLAGLLSVWLGRQSDVHQPDLTEQSAATRLSAAYASMVERYYRSSRTVAEYAAELGVTPTHLSRVCNQLLGRPASDILAERRDYEARRLLRETRIPVKDVASVLGFGSPAYFTRVFAKRSGMTPSAFRANREPARR